MQDNGKQSIATLLEGKANINLVPDPSKPSAFHLLAKNFPHQPELFKLFLEYGGDSNLIHNGETVLMTLIKSQIPLTEVKFQTLRPNSQCETPSLPEVVSNILTKFKTISVSDDEAFNQIAKVIQRFVE